MGGRYREIPQAGGTGVLQAEVWAGVMGGIQG